MHQSSLSRRELIGSLAAAATLASAASDDWVDLFDRKSMDGWRASENPTTWKFSPEDGGCLVNDGPRSHLFYTGPVRNARFRDFELEVEALAAPSSNSGIYFHTEFQEKGFPEKGFEIQINNSALGEGSYRERKKTGSLYGVRNVYKQLVEDNQWFRLAIAVRGRNIQVRVNNTLVVDYNEPTPPYAAPGTGHVRLLNEGTFAIQGHDPGSKVRIRRIRVRPLEAAASVSSVSPDATFKRLIDLGAANYPVVDYHAHLKGGLTLEQLLAKGRREGIFYGLAVNCGKGFPVESDDGARQFVESLKGQPVFIAMQAEGREWTKMFSSSAAGLFDYIFTDSMTWTDRHGRRMRLWIPEEVGTISDTAEFMDTLVERAVGILETEPVDIYVNPTFLPDAIAADYDKLWTEERMGKVIDAAARNKIAIEINDRYKLPSAKFIAMAKSAGCKFTFGTNNSGPADLRRCDYGLQMVEDCKLKWQDFFVPGAWWAKAVERKPNALRG